MESIKQTAVEWLAEKYNYITWMRNRDEISAGIADKWRAKYLEQANAKHKEQIIDAFTNEDNIQWDKQLRTRAAEQYYNEQYGGNK
jgi:ribonuclease HIII